MHIFRIWGRRSCFYRVPSLRQPTMKTSDKIAAVILWPGNKICNFLGVEGEDHRLILRLFMNLLIYGALSLIIMLSVID